jgi:hypothetical protein
LRPSESKVGQHFIASSVLDWRDNCIAENRGASPEQWERAFQVAWTRAAAAGGRPRIFTFDFVKD